MWKQIEMCWNVSSENTESILKSQWFCQMLRGCSLGRLTGMSKAGSQNNAVPSCKCFATQNPFCPKPHTKKQPHTQFGKSFATIYRLTVSLMIWLAFNTVLSAVITHSWWLLTLHTERPHTGTNKRKRKSLVVFLCPCLLYLLAFRYFLLNLVTLWPTSSSTLT